MLEGKSPALASPPIQPATAVPWVSGPPPDAFFAVKQCATPRWPLRFTVYDRIEASACERARESWRLEPSCATFQGRASTEAALRRQVLITGVQRSGTHFTWEFLNRLGVHVHHEGLGPAGAVSWLFTWRASNFVINNPARLTNDHRFCIILHQVRHPLKVISSIVRATKPRDPYWQWICSVEQDIDKGAPPPLRAAMLWVAQNRRLERIADARFKVEETSPRDVCRAAGFDERLCASDGSYHTTSSKVVQPIIEPKPVDPLTISDTPPPEYKPPDVDWSTLDRCNITVCVCLIFRSGSMLASAHKQKKWRADTATI